MYLMRMGSDPLVAADEPVVAETHVRSTISLVCLKKRIPCSSKHLYCAVCESQLEYQHDGGEWTCLSV